MKYIFIILSALLLLLPSCGSTYFFTSIKSLDYDMAQNDDGDFVSENDSVLVAYWFNGKDAPVFINVYNKTDQPLYVDWSRSSLIIGDEAMSYQGNIGDVSDEYSYGDDVSFIPPESRTTFNAMPFGGLSYENLNKKQFRKRNIPDKDGVLQSVEITDFDEQNTPLRFRSFLTMHRTPENPFSVEHSFYVSKIIKSGNLTPDNITDDLFKRGDIFYLEKENKSKYIAGDILLGTAIVGLVVVGIVWGGDDDSTVEYEED